MELKLKNFTKNDFKQYDLYLFCCSFDERSTALLTNAGGIDIPAICYYYIENKTSVHSRLQEIDKDYKSVIIKEISTDNPLYTTDVFMDTLTEKVSINTKRVLVDITTFSHESLLTLLKLLSINFPSCEIICAYINAKEYGKDESTKHRWLSRGIANVHSVIGYPGAINPTKKTHLIIIVGYEAERAYSIIDEIEPHSISLGYCKAENSTAEMNREANEQYTNLVFETSALYFDISKFEIKSNDVYSSAKIILEEIDKHSDKNVILVPLNNKMSTVASIIACYKRDNVQICYAKALEYNVQNYCKMGENLYIFSLPNQ